MTKIFCSLFEPRHGIAAALLLCAAQFASAAPALRLPEAPNEGLPLGQIFDYNIKDPSALGGRYYFVWGAKSAEFPAPVVASHYLPVGRDGNPKQARKLTWWQANHPDWVVYQADKKTPAWGFTYSNREHVPLDYSNPEVREWYFENLVLPCVKEGYPVVSFDNCSAATSNWDKRSGHFDKQGNWVELYTAEKDITKEPRPANDLAAWLSYLTTRLHALGVGSAANIGLRSFKGDLEGVKRAIEAVDVIVDEGGFTLHRDTNLTDAEWERKVAFLRQFLPRKKYLCSNTMSNPARPKGTGLPQDVEAKKFRGKLSEASHEQVAYAIGSFLIVREQGSMIFLCGTDEYGGVLDRPELHVPIGAPAAPPEKLPSGAWQRKYSGGLVLVNPSSKTPANIPLPAGAWKDFGEGAVIAKQVELPPNRALVLVGK